MPNIEVLDIASNDDRGLPDGSFKVELVNPLEVHFSQNVINPMFSDGRSVDEAVRLLTTDIEGNADGDDAVVLEPAFPSMEVVVWSPKLRDGNGKPLLDDFGNVRYGKEAMFSVDNRRLYVLQRAAVAFYPRRVQVEVNLIMDKVEVLKHIKKFRTRTNGLSITISEWQGVGRNNTRDYSAMRIWDWRSAVSRVQDEGNDPEAKDAAVDAAQKGSCGCWEYLDGKDIKRGPFSNWQMRQWWERKMLPQSLRVREYNANAASCKQGGRGEVGESEEVVASFRLATDVFRDAPAPFASGWSPRAVDSEAQARKCMRCNRKRFEGVEVDGQWLCQQCSKKRANKKSAAEAAEARALAEAQEQALDITIAVEGVRNHFHKLGTDSSYVLFVEEVLSSFHELLRRAAKRQQHGHTDWETFNTHFPGFTRHPRGSQGTKGASNVDINLWDTMCLRHCNGVMDPRHKSTEFVDLYLEITGMWEEIWSTYLNHKAEHPATSSTAGPRGAAPIGAGPEAAAASQEQAKSADSWDQRASDSRDRRADTGSSWHGRHAWRGTSVAEEPPDTWLSSACGEDGWQRSGAGWQDSWKHWHAGSWSRNNQPAESDERQDKSWVESKRWHEGAGDWQHGTWTASL